jgi:two-component system, NarL family, response regulator NreC
MTSTRHLTALAGGNVASTPQEITVVISEKHMLMRESLRTVLEHAPGISVSAEAGDLALAREHTVRQRPDVLVMDLHTPGGSIAETISDLCRRLPATHIVVVTVESSPALAAAALAAGASGYVLKDRADAELPSAVRAAARGERYVSEPIASRLASSRGARTGGRLSSRETEVLRLIALGHTSVEIAGRLALSPRTIETHRANIHRKLEMKTRAELVGYALRCGLLST